MRILHILRRCSRIHLLLLSILQTGGRTPHAAYTSGALQCGGRRVWREAPRLERPQFQAREVVQTAGGFSPAWPVSRAVKLVLGVAQGALPTSPCIAAHFHS